jgi:hypothetical protein
MNILTWVNNTGSISTDSVKGNLASKPVFSFNYDALYYEELDSNKFYLINSVRMELSLAEISEVKAYLSSFNSDNLLVQGVDANGIYLGFTAKKNVAAIVTTLPPTNQFWRYDFTSEEYKLIQGVDSTGKYLGNVALKDCFKDVCIPPGRLDINMLWDFTNNVWVDQRTPEEIATETLELVKTRYEASIDKLLDDAAIAKGYLRGIDSACSYAGAPNTFQAESIAFITWRSAVWDYWYSIYNAVKAGTSTIPTIEEILAALPPSP